MTAIQRFFQLYQPRNSVLPVISVVHSHVPRNLLPTDPNFNYSQIQDDRFRSGTSRDTTDEAIHWSKTMEQELVWYYIKDGQKVGPISLADAQQLIQRRQLSPNDLVWKNGLENWAAVKDVPELSPPSNPPIENQTIVTQPRQRPVRTPRAGGDSPFAIITTPLSLLKPIMQPMILIGLVMVIGGKGCDALSLRYVSRLQSLETMQQAKFNTEWDRKQNNIQAELEVLLDKSNRSDRDNDRIDKLQEDLSDLVDERSEARSKLMRGEWFETQAAAQTAASNHRATGIFREALFIFGTLVLTVALLIAGFTEEGPARWVCLIILAIIVFSIYIIGAPWISSIAGDFTM